MRLLLFFLITSITIFFNCNTTEPEMKAQYPPGYQHDIPWPSLDGVPFPKYRADAQNTGRSKFKGASSGIIETTIKQYTETAPLISADSLFYFINNTNNKSNLFAYDLQGNIKRKIPLLNLWNWPGNPTIFSDGNILTPYSILEIKLYGKNDSSMSSFPVVNVWKTNEWSSIGKDGEIYIISPGENKLRAYDKNGTVLWQFTGENIDGISISPDGNTIYTGSFNKFAIAALDAANGTVKWMFYGKSSSHSYAPAIDNQGNLYFIAGSKNSSEWYLYSLNENGEIRWKYQLTTKFASNSEQPAIDRYGNLYFGGNSLISLDYSGNKRWEFSFPNTEVFIDCHILIDSDNNIFFVTDDGMIYSLDRFGKLNWKIKAFKSDHDFFASLISIGYGRLIAGSRRIYNNNLLIVK